MQGVSTKLKTPRSSRGVSSDRLASPNRQLKKLPMPQLSQNASIFATLPAQPYPDKYVRRRCEGTLRRVELPATG